MNADRRRIFGHGLVRRAHGARRLRHRHAHGRLAVDSSITRRNTRCAASLEFLNSDGTRGPTPRLCGRCAVSSRHRGPDDDGFYTDGPVGIGMRRLSIVDVAGGHQPISNEDGIAVDRIQWRNLQPSRLARATHRTRPPLQHAQRYRNRHSPLRRVRRGMRAASARHVRFCHLESQYENALHRARPAWASSRCTTS